MTAARGSPEADGKVPARSARRLAWLLYGVTLALVGAGVGLWLGVHRPLPRARIYAVWLESIVSGLAFGALGVLITSRRPRHPVGWLLGGFGLLGGMQLLAGEYTAAMLAASGPSEGVAVAAWVASSCSRP